MTEAWDRVMVRLEMPLSPVRAMRILTRDQAQDKPRASGDRTRTTGSRRAFRTKADGRETASSSPAVELRRPVPTRAATPFSFPSPPRYTPVVMGGHVLPPPPPPPSPLAPEVLARLPRVPATPPPAPSVALVSFEDVRSSPADAGNCPPPPPPLPSTSELNSQAARLAAEAASPPASPQTLASPTVIVRPPESSETSEMISAVLARRRPSIRNDEDEDEEEDDDDEDWL